MKTLKLLYLLLLIWSCTQNRSGKAVLLNSHIPETYILRSALNVTKVGDTIFVAGKKYSGYLVQLHSNNIDTAVKEGYLNGLVSGETKKWYLDNKVCEHRYYLKGKKNGKQIAFWENGNKKFEFTANNDAYEGVMHEWNQEGKLIHMGSYKNGQEDGPQKLWYDNGKIRANYVIIKGKRYGLLGTKNCKNVSDSIFLAK